MLTYNATDKEQGSSKDGNPFTLNEEKAMHLGFTPGHDHKPNPYMYGDSEGTALSEMMACNDMIENAAKENAELNRKYGVRNAAIMTRMMAAENTMYDHYRCDVDEGKEVIHGSTDVWIDRIVEYVDIGRAHYLPKKYKKYVAQDLKDAQEKEDSVFRGLCR